MLQVTKDTLIASARTSNDSMGAFAVYGVDGNGLRLRQVDVNAFETPTRVRV